MSLSFRLFGNMMGHELVLMILFMLAGAFFAPLPIMAMGIFVAIVQAFVFFLLSIMYFSGSMEHAHKTDAVRFRYAAGGFGNAV